ncbi:hypothetical protein HPB49_011566 [Dermacentor silvarum]|uniref:Uncharacterized protein n=1 Tax=Dermacentor silvarum TaxID=543639 RepID=A0ACB8C3A4_DERSI|nr:hypothetical protein HPB49_011566 [Dermacentor silvarum]
MVPPPLDASAQFVLSDLLPHEELAAEMEDFRLTKEKLKTAGIVLGVGAVTGAVAVVAAPFVLAGLGFTSSGVATGSLAAGYQATLGGVIVKGSLFSLCQSAGAAGLAATGNATVALVAGSVGAAFTGVVSKTKQAKNPGNGTGDGTDTGSEAGTQERDKAEGASGTRKKGNGRYTCRECDCGSGTRLDFVARDLASLVPSEQPAWTESGNDVGPNCMDYSNLCV